MSRVIKFRVWDPRIGHYRKRDEWAITSDGQPLRYFEAGEGGYDVPGDKGLVIEQFTGLLDKNGVEIYEGDIVEYPYSHIPIPVGAPPYGDTISGIHRGVACWQTEMGYSPARWCVAQFGNERGPNLIGSQSAVVGNIHEHSHLLSS